MHAQAEELHKLVPPLGQSRNDYDIFSGLAKRLGVEQEFTDGKDEGDWVEHLADPMSLEVHGNPNALTRDAGTSKLAQGPSAYSCLVEVEKFTGELPDIRVFSQPPAVTGKPVHE